MRVKTSIFKILVVNYFPRHLFDLCKALDFIYIIVGLCTMPDPPAVPLATPGLPAPAASDALW